MIAVIGTGAWGTTLATLLSRFGQDTVLVARTKSEAENLSSARENTRFLPGVRLPATLSVLPPEEARLTERRLILLVVPSQRMRENVAAIRPYLGGSAVYVSAAKGLETGSGLRMTQVVAAELAALSPRGIAALSGPNLSAEVAQGLPTASVVACDDEGIARTVQEMLRLPNLRLYSNTDVVGVELAGALKNVIALGAGVCDGLGYGDNAKAAFLTRGLAEIARLGVAMGANPLTFAGLAGVGDLVATCASPYSRNRYLGEQIGKGRALSEVQDAMGHVAEGVDTTAAACRLAERFGVEMPITEKMAAVLFGGLSPREGVDELMMRDQKGEFAGIDLGSIVKRSADSL